MSKLIDYEEPTAMKHQEATASPKANIRRQNIKNWNLHHFTVKTGFKNRMECQLHATSLFRERMKFKGMYRVMCTSGAQEQLLSTAKAFILQEVTITLEDNVYEIPVDFDMPSNYIMIMLVENLLSQKH
jgi:hypothetical protein